MQFFFFGYLIFLLSLLLRSLPAWCFKVKVLNRNINIKKWNGSGSKLYSTPLAEEEEEDASDRRSYTKDWIRFAARIAYDGRSFYGWQTQDDEDNVRTVQGVLSRALSKRFNRPIRVTGASRTDQGVSARGQAIHFDIPISAVTSAETTEDEKVKKEKTTKKRSPTFTDNLQFTLNRMLPDDVRIFNLTIAPNSSSSSSSSSCGKNLWHSTKDATGKLYVYKFCTNSFVDPLKRRYCAHVYRKFDPNVFLKCLSAFVGTHDFAAFANRVEHTANELEERGSQFTSIRTINSINLIDEGEGYWRVEIHLESALYRMCRNIIGTSLFVASGDMAFETLQALLQNGGSRNDNKAKSAPPEGLCLEHVYYEGF